MAWEELSVKLAARTAQQVQGIPSPTMDSLPSSRARVSRALQVIESAASRELSVGQLAKESGLSPYHFLRTFEAVVGATPHQYILRTRLREAAIRVATGQDKILDVAFDTGFGDVSNFNRAFRAEFRASPKKYRLGVSR